MQCFERSQIDKQENIRKTYYIPCDNCYLTISSTNISNLFGRHNLNFFLTAVGVITRKNNNPSQQTQGALITQSQSDTLAGPPWAEQSRGVNTPATKTAKFN